MRYVCLVAGGLALVAALSGCSATGDPPRPAGTESPEAEAHDEHVFGAADLGEKFDHVDGYAQSAVIPSELGATRAGLLVDALAGLGEIPLTVEVRGVLPDQSTTEWVTAEVTWREGPHVVARADFGETVVATQFRIPLEQAGGVAQITYNAGVPEESGAAGDGEPLAQTQEALSSAFSGLVQPRSAWNARATKCTSKDKKKYRMAIHHTYTSASSSNGYEARLRSIQAYHMDTRGWCDVGYHFLVTQDGRVWEGRAIDFVGAHVGNNNSGNAGISWVGCFHPGECESISSTVSPPQPMLDAGSHIIRKLSDIYGIAIDSAHVKPHGGHSGASTSCPGKNLQAKIPSLLEAAKSGGSPSPGPSPNPSPSPGTLGRAVGVVWDLGTGSSPAETSAKRVTNASVSVDGGPAKPVRVTDAYWELDLAPGKHTLSASAPGYASATKSVEVVAGQTSWASIGILPAASDTLVEVTLLGPSGQKLPDGIVYAPGLGAERAESDGIVRLKLPPGSRELSVFHDGYAGLTTTLTVQATSLQPVSVKLASAPKPASTGRVQGVVWDETVTSAPSSAGNVRLDHAIVICSCGQAKKARAGDAYWYFDAAPGSYTITVVASGYASESVSSSFGAGANVWSSVGLTP